MIHSAKCFHRLLGWGVLAAALTLVSAPAGAHSLLVDSDPENGTVQHVAPGHVMARYSQELESRLSILQVFDSEGRQVDEGDGGVDLNDPDHTSMNVRMPAALPSGDYTVRWTAVSADDGDQSEGEFKFTVGADAQP